MTALRRFRTHIVVLLLIVATSGAARGDAVERSFQPDAESEIPLTVYPAEGERLFLWFPSESGVLEQERAQAQRLADAGIEVWLADLHTAYFLPTVSSSIEKMPVEHLSALIERAVSESGKTVYLIGPGKGALLALRGARRWQRSQRQHGQRLGGLILISPKLYLKTPEPGLEGEFMPVVGVSNVPVYVLQPAKSIWRWKLGRIVPALSGGGSDVFVRILPGVRDRFYYRPDAVDEEMAMAKRMPVLLAEAIPMLQTIADKTREPVGGDLAAPERGKGATGRSLRAYQGDPEPPALDLKDLQGDTHTLADYTGDVVLVNFWASWCPPCVHEMPSMQRLKNRMAGRDFKILAVNMAEDQNTIRDFLTKMVNVDFTILLDVDGAALGRWKVFAFPTTYVIDRNGAIRYALYGAIDWDKPEVVDKIEVLLNE